MSQKLQLKFKPSTFDDFLQKFQDLASIDEVVKLKIDKDEILMYSVVSNEVTVLALKSYNLKTLDIIENFNEDYTLDFIITSAPKFAKNLKFFNTDAPIKLDLVFKPLPDDKKHNAYKDRQFQSGKLKISTIGGEQYRIRDLTKTLLNAKLNPKLSKWSFDVSSEDFGNIKKLSTINNEDRTFNIQVDNGKVTFNESSKWELEVANIDDKNANIIFNKKYLSNITSELDTITFYIFETFILIKDEESNLMLSFEQDFTNED